MNTADIHLRYERDRRIDLIEAARRRELATRIRREAAAESRRLPAPRWATRFRGRLHLPGPPPALSQ